MKRRSSCADKWELPFQCITIFLSSRLMRPSNLLLLLALCVLAVRAASYDPYFTRSLGVFYHPDETLTGRANLLFRSNVPEDEHGHFMYHELLEVVVDKARQDRKVMINADNVHLVVISLVEDTNAMLAVEDDYFARHPHRGEHINWPVFGQGEDPAGVATSRIQRQVTDLDWMNTDIEALVQLVQQKVNDFSSSKNVIVVIHDDAGYVLDPTTPFLSASYDSFLVFFFADEIERA